MAAPIKAIGLMSGTSLDGVDVALVETDGERVNALGPTGYRAYSEKERGLLRQALAGAAALSDRAARPGVLAEAERLVTEAHAEAVEKFFAEERIDRGEISLVGFHGQTVLHRPHEKLTVQIGDGRALAGRLQIPVAYDFRAADVAAGGQGAPLVPIFHQSLARDLAHPKPIAVLNIGGVANVTYVGDGDPIACDTGPGNALIDDFMRARTGAPSDKNGEAAASGRVDQAFVDRVLAHSFFDRKPPKSLDRNDFALSKINLPDLPVADGAATLSALTVQAVAHIVLHLPSVPRAWIVAGGGSRNRTLMRMLSEQLAPATVEAADDVGWSADALEAQAFAFLAVRCLYREPLTFPTTTDAPRPITGGIIVKPDTQ